MNKGIIMTMAGVGGIVGSYLPTLFGASSFSGWSLLCAFLGGLAGIYVGFKIND